MCPAANTGTTARLRHSDMMGPVEQSDAQATITVFQDRSWFGDRRLGAFVLTVDGKRAGVVRVQGSLTVDVQPGQHVLRVRQWWYRSRAVRVDVQAAETVRLKAGVDRSVGFLRRWVRFMFKPSTALSLTLQT